MIVVKLIGGLGNQMFQYASAYVIAKHNDATLKLDTLYYRDRSKRHFRFEYRPYALSLFNISALVATPKDISKFVFPRIVNKYLYHVLKYFWPTRNIVKECDIKTKEDLLKIGDNKYIEGYFQNYSFFGDYIEDLKKEFFFKEDLPETHKDIAKNIINTHDSVCVSFRRGDYVGHPVLGIVELDFYYKALDVLKSKVKENIKLFVFSDDIEWCKKNFITNENIYFVDQKYTGPLAGYYFQLMMLCNHFIIPNSTYPYWAALLSDKSENKIVIAPKVWYRGQNPEIRNCILPPEWIAI